MIRLPRFEYRAPRTVAEAADLLAARGDAMLIAGGTDLIPNMKRRQQTPRVLVGLQNVAELKRRTNGSGHTIGAGLTLAALVRDESLRRDCSALWQAAAQVATPHLRAMGTFGGNICLDTRCNYYDQSYEWRKAIDFCMKKDGAICWVAPSSPRCWAVQSSDGVPVAVAVGAEVTLVSARGTRRLPAAGLYRNDGIQYLEKAPDELLVAYHLPPIVNGGWRASYRKLRRRDAFDFPVLGVAARVDFAPDGSVSAARVVLGAVASHPQEIPEAGTAIVGTRLDDSAIGAAADAAYRPAKPMDNTDFTLAWRKDMVRVHVQRALQDIRAQAR
jgi:4-hydroxybenzoyl-CoA reductase subunit beta